jgi:translation elongation factor EF-1beta
MSLLNAENDESYRLMFYKYAISETAPRKLSMQKEQKQDQKVQKQDQKKQTKKVSDDIDLFGDDDNEKVETKPKVVAPKPAPKAKKVVIAKSIIVFDVKVYDTEQDLKALAERIYKIEMDGLIWNKDLKILPVAFGMNKLQVGCVVEDAKVSIDDILEIVEGWEDDVQSCDIVTFQKV